MYRKLALTICPILIVATCLPACSSQSGTQQTSTPVAANTITLTRVNTGKLTMAKGSTYDIDAVADPSGATLTYSSSDEKVATVSASGTISAQATGTATITVKATTGDATEQIALTVVKESQYVAVKSIEPISSELHFNQGESGKLKVRFTPSDASNKNLIYTSSDPGIASVSASGEIKAAEQAETVTITIKSAETENVQAKVTILVEPNIYNSTAN